MRFHKFSTEHGPLWIDLDRIAGMRRDSLRTMALVDGAWLEVDASVNDVLALVSPAAALDTYEEALSAHRVLMEAQALPLVDAIKAKQRAKAGACERVARQDELNRLARRFHDPLGMSKLTRYIDERWNELEQGEA